jgi:hypothetical protein
MGLAAAEAAAGDLDVAFAILTAAIDDARRTHGPRHPHTIALIECADEIGLRRGE